MSSSLDTFLINYTTSAMVSYIDVGVLRDTLLPNLAFHSTLAIPAYLIGRSVDRLASKDVLWSTGQLSNVLYTAIIRPSLVQGIPLERVLRNISRPGWVTIAGVSLWGTRLAYRIVSRTAASGRDDPRYAPVKQDRSGWTKSFFTTFIPEAIVQSLITLAVTIPFRVGIPVVGAPREYAGIIDALAIGLWSTGFALEVLADWQLAAHKEAGDRGLLRQGVWSIVRHPK
jgi:steroid 5-alpha reductase family enzyme